MSRFLRIWGLVLVPGFGAGVALGQHVAGSVGDARVADTVQQMPLLPALSFIAGAIISLLLCALVRVAARGGRGSRGPGSARALHARHARCTESFSSIMVVHAALDGRLLKVPATMCRLLGYRRNDLLALRIQDITHADDRERSISAMRSLVEGKRRSFECEKRYLRRDGSAVWLAASIGLVSDEDGRPSYILGYLRDVTERRRSEEELRRVYDELEQRVQQRTAELRAANRELEAFSYSVSHDLRAPVRHIAGFLKMLERSIGPRLEPGEKRFLVNIESAAARMGQLIDDLLEFSRTSRAELKVGTIDMTDAARRAAHELAPELAGRAVRLSIADMPAALGDGALVHLVWLNLLSNAVKYTAPRAEAVIEAGAGPGEQPQEAVYFVRDNGVGFDMKYAGKLFGVFQRMHSSAEFEGTGIGLATVHRILARHGGRIWVQAEAGKGATFYFTLRTAALEPAQRQAA